MAKRKEIFQKIKIDDWVLHKKYRRVFVAPAEKIHKIKKIYHRHRDKREIEKEILINGNNTW